MHDEEGIAELECDERIAISRKQLQDVMSKLGHLE